MNDSFLDIIKITGNDMTYGESFPESFYQSEHLSESIEKLITSRIRSNEVSGKRVLLKPNWVKHSVNQFDDICMRTNDQVVVAALEAILKMKPASVVIGDAPIQGCKWDKMIRTPFTVKLKDLSEKYAIPVRIEDFRRRVYDISKNNPLTEIRPLSDYLLFDLAEKSLLEPVTSNGTFRVNNYDPDRMTKVHSRGKHIYCLIREFFESDLILQLPKIKTHQKTGITGALKNLVGINGDKDFLPHHRMGGTGNGGDCYPGRSVLRYWSELLIDKANRRQGHPSFWLWQKLSSVLWHLSVPGPEHNLDAGWHGNDTTWRMVADINRIALFGTVDGIVSDHQQRKIYSLCDAIIAGQGNGPLEPDPLPLGILTFTDNSAFNDLAMAKIMGLPVGKIPMLQYFQNAYASECAITLNGEITSYDELDKHAVHAIPPAGWISYLKSVQ